MKNTISGKSEHPFAISYFLTWINWIFLGDLVITLATWKWLSFLLYFWFNGSAKSSGRGLQVQLLGRLRHKEYKSKVRKGNPIWTKNYQGSTDVVSFWKLAGMCKILGSIFTVSSPTPKKLLSWYFKTTIPLFSGLYCVWWEFSGFSIAALLNAMCLFLLGSLKILFLIWSRVVALGSA